MDSTLPTTNSPPEQTPDAPPPTTRMLLRRNALQIGIFLVMLALWALFIVAAPRTFLSPDIYASFMATVPFFGIVAIPLTMVVIAGDIDLSFPSIMAVGVVAFLQVFHATGSIGLAFVACLAAGFIVGWINGIIVVRLGIPSLIATIGTQFFWRGFILVVTNGRNEVLTEAKNSLLGQIFVGKIANYVPMQMVWFILIGVAVWLLLNRHRFGAHTYLIGDNMDSARLMGVNVNRTRILLFAIVGVASALAGLIASLHVTNFFTTLGEGYLLTTLASIFLGGTSVFGGVGSILGTFIATFIIGSINAGIVAIGLTGFWTQLIYGLIITLSVTMHMIVRRRVG